MIFSSKLVCVDLCYFFENSLEYDYLIFILFYIDTELSQVHTTGELLVHCLSMMLQDMSHLRMLKDG